MNQLLLCDNEKRRHLVREKETYNGLDYLEISPNQKVLTLYFLGKVPEGLTRNHFRISGGRRIRNIEIVDMWVCEQSDPELDNCVKLVVDKAGDFSTYRLCLVELDENGRLSNNLLTRFDPRYTCLDFSFKVNCDTGLDCQIASICPPEPRTEPPLNYLAKDYASFRQLILDRLALIMPDWEERHVPDVGMALVELLAYTGDRLSYYQDAVATEAYLHTARQRISVRRHARLVDYQMHEGCNARAWVHVAVNTKVPLPPNGVAFITGYNDALPVNSRLLSKEELNALPSSQYELFEPILEEPGSLLFSPADWKDPVCMATKIWQTPDDKDLDREMLTFLKGQFSKKWADEVVSGSVSGALQSELVRVFNHLIQRTHFFGEENEARKIVWEWPFTHEELIDKNRALLEQTFPQEIARRRRQDDPIILYPAHNEIAFYTWDDTECCLPRGATRATLLDDWESSPPPPVEQHDTKEPAGKEHCWRQRKLRHLQPGDVLIFEEVCDPKTGLRADANPKHRHAVRLTEVKLEVDPLHDKPVVEIAWAGADALPFSLCLSAVGRPPDCKLIQSISVARGNIILVDHGCTYETDKKKPWQVPTQTREQTCLREKRPSDLIQTPGRFRPILPQPGLTFSQPLSANAPASALLTQDPREAIPQITLTSYPDGATWKPQRDLLESTADDRAFVVEMDNDRQAHLRFGDGELGKQPEAGTGFTAEYRLGNGLAGNVGAESLTHIVLDQMMSGVIFEPRNPLPAQGGQIPESMADVKLFAPHAFRRRLERAITADDYANIVMRDFADRVQRAAATLRWTGSWSEVLVAVDPRGEAEPDEALLADIGAHLERYRRMGHDVVVKTADYVPLDVTLRICVLPHYLQGHVRAALLARLSNRRLPDGQLGFFHPDALTFGEGVYLSRLTAVAQAVSGVESVVVEQLERFAEGPNSEIKEGILRLGPLEVARLDHDPSLPENGRLTLIMEGGR